MTLAIHGSAAPETSAVGPRILLKEAVDGA